MSKKARIIRMYKIFMISEEVEMKELFYSFGDYDKKTFFRDIAFLKRVGLPIKYSRKRHAYVFVDESGKEDPYTNFRNDPIFPKRAKERQNMEMLMRLMKIVSNMPEDYCEVWYKETFPHISKRTMHRDFAFLREELGYEIYYVRSADFCQYGSYYDRETKEFIEIEFKPHYECEIPGYW